MTSVGAYEAKTHLAELLERVRRGERITITKHGVPVAVLQPPDERQREDPAAVIEELRAFRGRHSLRGISIRDMIKEGRR
jgi:prevent-host-death family protein